MTRTTFFDLLKNSGIVSGSIVISTAGHDKNRIYTVLRVDDKIAFVCDGVYRIYENPKKKRVTHLKQIGMINDMRENSDQSDIADVIELKNRLVQRWISEYIKENKQSGKEKL